MRFQNSSTSKIDDDKSNKTYTPVSYPIHAPGYDDECPDDDDCHVYIWQWNLETSDSNFKTYYHECNIAGLFFLYPSM